MCFSLIPVVRPAAEPPLVDSRSASLPPQLPEVSFPSIDSASADPPRIPELHFSLRRSNAVRRSATFTNAGDSSPQSQSTAHTELDHTAQPAKNGISRRSSPSRNYSLPIYQPKQPWATTRYYALNLTPIDRVALARGDQNHNHKLWTPKDVRMYEEGLIDLMPTNRYKGPDGQMHMVPHIVVTNGRNERAHKKQLRVCLRAPPTSALVDNARELAASSGSYFAQTLNRRPRPFSSISASRVRSPLAVELTAYTYSPEVTFDGFLTPHPSGKGEVYRESEDAE